MVRDGQPRRVSGASRERPRVLPSGHTMLLALPISRCSRSSAGDCRAVVGQFQPAGSETDKEHPLANAGALLNSVGERASNGPIPAAPGWSALELSRDHNAREPVEQAKLAAAHPGEPNVVRENHPGVWYVRGRLQPTRALGDMYLKHTEMNGQPGTRAWGKYLSPRHTPPYITPEPEVRVHELNPSTDAFVILACDGVWDVMSSDEAVAVVSQHQGTRDSAANTLVEAALAKAAAQANMSPQQLAQIAPGRPRRGIVDDLTVVVLWLDTPAAHQAAVATSRLSAPTGDGRNWGWFSRSKQAPESARE